MIGVDVRLLCISYDRISSVASIPPMKGIDTSIYNKKRILISEKIILKRLTHQNDIKRLILSHPSFKRINRQTTIFRNLNSMSILFKNLNCQFLVNEVVLRKKDIKGNVVWRRHRTDGVGFQSRNES